MFRPLSSRDEAKNIKNRDFTRSMPSNTPQPIFKQHELYSFDSNNKELKKSIDRQFQNTRNFKKNKEDSNNNMFFRNQFQFNTSQNQQQFLDRDVFKNSNKPVQNFSFKNNNLDYRLNNFHSLNNDNSGSNNINKFFDRNPVNSRRDFYESQRDNDIEEFKKIQGGVFKTITSRQQPQPTRERKPTLKTNYIPNTRSMGIPKNSL